MDARRDERSELTKALSVMLCFCGAPSVARAQGVTEAHTVEDSATVAGASPDPFESDSEAITAFSITIPLGLGGIVGGSLLLRQVKYASTEEGEWTLASLGILSHVMGAGIAAFGTLVLIDFATTAPATRTAVSLVPTDGGVMAGLVGTF